VFADWDLEQLEVNPNFTNKSSLAMRSILDEWNKQNCRIWDDTNPREIHQLQMYSEKVFDADFGLAE